MQVPADACPCSRRSLRATTPSPYATDRAMRPIRAAGNTVVKQGARSAASTVRDLAWVNPW